MIEALEQSLQAGRADFLDASDEEIAGFVGDMLKQISILMEFTALPSGRKVNIRRAIEVIEASLEPRDGPAAASKNDRWE